MGERAAIPEAAGGVRGSDPTLILHNEAGDRRLLDVDHSYDDHLAALKDLAPEIGRSAPPTIEWFVRNYGRVATEEVSVVCEISWEEAEEGLEERVQSGRLRKRPVGSLALWEWVG